MGADLLAEQIAYYRARADEYDATSYPPGRASADRIAATVASLGVSGRLLELACGTGMWTRDLARTATVTAVDAAPETIAVARRRCPPTVRFVVGDVFEWNTEDRFDTVFFAAWLSHVPPERYAGFFDRVASWLAPGGRAIFVDEPTRSAAKERTDGVGVAVRTLSNGSTYRIVKHFLDPIDLAGRLAALGWRTQIADRGDWLVAEARRR